MNKKRPISARLREFGEKKFSSMTEFSSALNMMPQTLNSYLSGASGIGSKMQEKLRILGCDIEWLMTGTRKENPTLPFETIALMKIPVYKYIKAGGKAMGHNDPGSTKIYVHAVAEAFKKDIQRLRLPLPKKKKAKK